MNFEKNYHKILITILLFLALFFSSCSKTDNKANAAVKESKGVSESLKAEMSVAIQVEQVKRGDLINKLYYSGALKAESEVTIYSQIPERILKFPFENGDTIKKGQIIAYIRSDSLMQATNQINAQIEALDVQISNLKTELERSTKLFNEHVITEQTLDSVKAGYEAAIAQRKSLVATMEQMKISTGNAHIKAPMSGVIANINLEKGDMASPQFPICSVMDIDTLKLELKLKEKDVVKVKKGQIVHITLDAYPGKVFEGRISRILPYLDPALFTNTIEVGLDNPVDKQTGERVLKPGMYARAVLETERRENIVIVPEKALMLDDEFISMGSAGENLRKAYVVSAGDKAKERTVKIGLREGAFYEAVEGIKEGEQIVTRGQYLINDGQKVKVFKETEKRSPEAKQ